MIGRRYLCLASCLALALTASGTKITVYGEGADQSSSSSGGSSGNTSSSSSSGSSGQGGSGGSDITPDEAAYAFYYCSDNELDLLVEVPPEPFTDCEPPSDIIFDGMLVIGITGWTGVSGTFTLGEETPNGTAGAAFDTPDPLSGFITISADDSGRVQRMTWELVSESGAQLRGAGDTSGCAFDIPTCN